MKIILPTQKSYVKVLNIHGANQFKKQQVSLKISNSGETDVFKLEDKEYVEVEHDYSFELATLDLFGLFITALCGNKSAELKEEK